MKLHASFTSYLKYYRKVLVIKSSFCLVVLDELLHQQISFFTSFFNFIWYCLKKRSLSEIFFPSFNILWEKDGFTQTHNPLNGQNLLRVTKSFRPCSLTFSKESLPDFACAQKWSERKLNCSVSLNITSIIITVQKFQWSDWLNGVQLNC